MEYAFILFILMSIGFTVLWIFGKIFRMLRPREKQEKRVNPYISFHASKMIDDRDYEEYLRFCAEHGEPPLEKSGFDAIRKKERAIERLIK